MQDNNPPLYYVQKEPGLISIMQNIKDVGVEGGKEIWCEERETGSTVIEISVQSCKQQVGFFYPVKCAKNATLKIRLRKIRDEA